MDALTPRQLQILDLVARGLTNQDICGVLTISTNTVKVHVAAIIRALGVANRTEAASVYTTVLNDAQHSTPEARVASRIGRPSIAVLPFEVISDAADAEHFADGLAEDLITRLSSWRWFPVIAHASSRRFASGELDLEDVRRRLGVRYLITGSARRSAEHARINVHLIETDAGRSLWSDAYTFELDDVIRTQEEIAKRVISHIAPELLELEGRVLAVTGGDDFDAWQSTMSGMWYLARRTEADAQRAAELFESAIDQDPSLALPWFGLVWVHHHAVVEQWTDDRECSIAAMAEAADACFRLDPNGAASLIVMGLKELVLGDVDHATTCLERAAHLNPSSTQAHALLGQCYCLGGRPDEAIAAAEEALILNPFNPNAWAQKGVIALAHFASRRYPEALKAASDALGDRPQSITAHLVVVATQVEQNDLAAAAESHAQFARLRPNFDLDSYLRLIAPAALPENMERLRAAFARVEAT